MIMIFGWSYLTQAASSSLFGLVRVSASVNHILRLLKKILLIKVLSCSVLAKLGLILLVDSFSSPSSGEVTLGGHRTFHQKCVLFAFFTGFSDFLIEFFFHQASCHNLDAFHRLLLQCHWIWKCYAWYYLDLLCCATSEFTLFWVVHCQIYTVWQKFWSGCRLGLLP